MKVPLFQGIFTLYDPSFYVICLGHSFCQYGGWGRDPGDLAQDPDTGIPEKCWRGCWQKWGCWPECWHRCWQAGPLVNIERQHSRPAPVPALRPAPPFFLPAPVPAPPLALFWNSRFGVLCQVARVRGGGGCRTCYQFHKEGAV